MTTTNLTWFAALTLSAGICVAAPLGTAFTYQGKLADGGQPANGNYDLKFTLYDGASGGTAVAGPITNSPTGVTNGLFTTTLDFGVNVFSGEARWLETSVRTNGGGVFATFPTRQLLTPAPYALWAQNAGLAGAGAVSASSLNTLGSPAPGQVLTYNGSQLAWTSLSSTGAAWSTFGNSGTVAGANFLGTTDTNALDLKVNNQRALRLEPSAGGGPNVIGGHALNRVTPGVYSATIAGGGSAGNAHLVSTNGGTISGGTENQVLGLLGTVGGGKLNTAGGAWATVDGGHSNTAGGDYAAVGGGRNNLVRNNADYSTIGGGVGNSIGTNSAAATIAGGSNNIVSAAFASIGGGYQNTNNSEGSVVGGGIQNTIETPTWNATVGGGYLNTIGDTSNFAVIGGGAYNEIQTLGIGATIAGGTGNQIQIGNGSSTIGGGQLNKIQNEAYFATIGGGGANMIQSYAEFSIIGGGEANTVGSLASGATIAGGMLNAIGSNAAVATVSGGSNNTVETSAVGATIGGGIDNQIQAAVIPGSTSLVSYATISGGNGNGASGLCAVIGGGTENTASGLCATVSGGVSNTSSNDCATVSGGRFNTAGGAGAFVGGGGFDGISHGGNTASGSASTVGGGFGNVATNLYATVGGGWQNRAYGYTATIAGGATNTASANWAAVGGGWRNTASGRAATVAGGYDNAATGNFSFAAGSRAIAQLDGCFVWADSTPLLFDPTALLGPQGVTNSFNVRSTGGFYIATGVDSNDGHITSGVQLLSGAGAWSSWCDRNAKTNWASVEPRAVLDKVAALPIATWNYKTQDPSIRHMGPMAQDFHAAFGVGDSDKTITTVDADGVALAAIQGLNQKVEAREARIQEQAAEIQALKARLEKLEQLLTPRPRGGQ